MHKFIFPLCVQLATLSFGLTASIQASGQTNQYTLIIEAFDWGPAVSKIVLDYGRLESFDYRDFEVMVHRSSPLGSISEAEATGPRRVIYAYISDHQSMRKESGAHLTLVLAVAPNDPLGSPIKYFMAEGGGRNQWINYQVTIREKSSGRTWSEEGNQIMPPISHFDLNGRFESGGIQLSYASFEPNLGEGQRPLLIWLHGGGEGGQDPRIPLLANRATNYASDEIQALLGGAHVLVPQCPGAWMHNEQGVSTRGKEDDMYHQVLMQLIQHFVERKSNIDPGRIYLGGCSNGGYMTLKLILEHPNYFAAGFISALAYRSEYITDQQITQMKHVPIWFVHSADDSVTDPHRTVLPLYRRLISSGANDVHLSYYDHVTDITGFYGGAGYQYNGHWSWIYCHANKCRLDFDGQPVKVDGKNATILEWLGAQSTK